MIYKIENIVSFYVVTRVVYENLINIVFRLCNVNITEDENCTVFLTIYIY